MGLFDINIMLFLEEVPNHFPDFGRQAKTFWTNEDIESTVALDELIGVNVDDVVLPWYIVDDNIIFWLIYDSSSIELAASGPNPLISENGFCHGPETANFLWRPTEIFWEKRKKTEKFWEKRKSGKNNRKIPQR